jgi:GNAT superfamily N-acetyltransferase
MPDIRPVHSRAEWKQFVNLPYQLHADDPMWIPPLRREERKLLDRNVHPYHQHAETEYFLAWDGGRPVGRIAASVNHQYDAKYDDDAGFFGFFESPDDSSTASGLLAAAGAWLTEHGRACIRGPFNFSTNETCGLLVDGFDTPPVFLMPHNPIYYGSLIEQAGLAKVKDLIAFEFDATAGITGRVRKISDRILRSGDVVVRNFRMNDLENEIQTVMKIYNEAWADNWGSIPITDGEMKAMAREIKPILNPELALVIEINGTPAAFSLTVPDLNQALKGLDGKLFPFGWAKLLSRMKKITRCRMITMGVLPEFRKRGVETLLYTISNDRAQPMGYTWGELSWVLEDNHMLSKALISMGCNPYKTYRLYEQTL